MYDAVILCGGLATRIRSMLSQGQPKIMADINGRPFIEILSAHIKGHYRPRCLMFVAGFGATEVRHWVNRFSWALGCTEVIEEPEPLGTGGALRMVLQRRRGFSDPFLLFNGDTIIESMGTEDLVAAHNDSGKQITAVRVDDRQTNAGLYVVSHNIQSALEWEPRKKFDIEELPLHACAHTIAVCDNYIDIGTPAGLLMARDRYKL